MAAVDDAHAVQEEMKLHVWCVCLCLYVCEHMVTQATRGSITCNPIEFEHTDVDMCGVLLLCMFSSMCVCVCVGHWCMPASSLVKLFSNWL